jgi:cytochrome oxidase Cu insertion factor (SCO1/SenC/PrrC family)
MTLSPRVKLLLIFALFALPMVASFTVYNLFPPDKSSNYGELLPPTPAATHGFTALEGGEVRLADLGGKWVMVVSDSGQCPQPCLDKLTTLRQVRLALGRKADRVTRVLVVDDLTRPDPALLKPFEGTRVLLTPTGLSLPAGVANDRAHIYLIDPRGFVMMRWPAGADRKRLLRDLDRLLRASQIG